MTEGVNILAAFGLCVSLTAWSERARERGGERESTFWQASVYTDGAVLG